MNMEKMTLEEKLEYYQRQTYQLKKRRDDANDKIKYLNGYIRELHQEINSLNDEIEQLKAICKDHRDHAIDFKADCVRLEKENEQLKKQLEIREKAHTRCDELYWKLYDENEQLKQDKSNLHCAMCKDRIMYLNKKEDTWGSNKRDTKMNLENYKNYKIYRFCDGEIVDGLNRKHYKPEKEDDMQCICTILNAQIHKLNKLQEENERLENKLWNC